MRVKFFALLLRITSLGLLAGGAYYGIYLHNSDLGFNLLVYHIGLESVVDLFFKDAV